MTGWGYKVSPYSLIHLNIMKYKYYYLFFLLFYSTHTFADSSIQLISHKNKSCTIDIYHYTGADSKSLLKVKSFDNNHQRCNINNKSLSNILDKDLHVSIETNTLSDFGSIFLGRLISYRWLSDYLLQTAKNDKNWDALHGKPLKGSSNQYVNATLHIATLLKPLSYVLNKHSYKLSGVSCEKILINRQGLPFDGMCWLLIQ